MQRIVIAVALFVTMVLATPAWAQRDTTEPGMFFVGRLIEATATSLSLESHDASGTVSNVTFGIDAKTIVDGCTLDEVTPGTQTAVVATADPTGRLRAEQVKFDGCGPSWFFVARVTSVSATTLGVVLWEQSDLGGPGTKLDLRLTDATTVLACSGEALTTNDLTVDAAVAVVAAGTAADGYNAVNITMQDDCPQSLYTEAAFVSFDGTVFTVVDRAGNDTLRLALSSEYGKVRDDATLPVFSCDGMPVDAASLVEGEVLNVFYIVVPKRGSFLQYAQRTQGCPIHVSGKVIARDSRSITVQMRDATFAAMATSETAITSCERSSVTIDDVIIGSYVQATIVQQPQGNILRSVQLLEGCPYAFYAYGTVSAVDASSITVEGHTSEEDASGSAVINLDETTPSINCLGLLQSIKQVTPGASVTVYYRMARGQRIADMVVVQSPCDVAAVHGIIEAVTDRTVVISEGGTSSMTYIYNADTKVTNCSGEVVSFDAAMVGASLSAVYATTSKPPMLVSATVNVGCQVISTIGGVITAIEDSSATVLSQGNVVMLNRSPYTAAYDALLMPIAWDALRVGDSVCCYYDEQGKLLYRIIAGVDCSLRATAGSTSMVGSIVRADDTEIVVEGRAGTMSFAITQATEMTSTMDRPVVMADLTAGTMVNVISSSYKPSGQPVASTIAVMAVTSVDDTALDQPSLMLYPNPASQSVTIANAVHGDCITIIDQQGNRVLRTTSPVVGLGTLAPGMYTVIHSVGTATMAAPLVIIR